MTGILAIYTAKWKTIHEHAENHGGVSKLTTRRTANRTRPRRGLPRIPSEQPTPLRPVKVEEGHVVVRGSSSSSM